MKRIALALAISAALAACTTTNKGMPPDMSRPPPMPSPVGAMDWILNAEEDSATLVYGTPESDDMRLSLQCRGGQEPGLTLVAVGPAGAPAEIVLSAGGRTQRYAALSEEEPMTGGVMLMSHARKTDPVIAAFRETGWLTFGSAGAAENLIPQHNTSAVADFFEWCGA